MVIGEIELEKLLVFQYPFFSLVLKGRSLWIGRGHPAQ
jgi:hypothetical protein